MTTQIQSREINGIWKFILCVVILGLFVLTFNEVVNLINSTTYSTSDRQEIIEEIDRLKEKIDRAEWDKANKVDESDKQALDKEIKTIEKEIDVLEDILRSKPQ